MKKIVLQIILVVSFFPFIVNAETCDINKISISSITVEEKNGGVEELSDATINRMDINLNLAMTSVGDSIEYKIIVKNDNNDDFELDKNSININSDYIDYVLESEDSSNIVKGNSSKLVHLKIYYSKEVVTDAFVAGEYTEKKNITLQLVAPKTSNVLDTLKNPNTGVHLYLLLSVIFLVLLVAGYIIFKNTKHLRLMLLIVGIVISIPLTVSALCKSEITINSNIKINYLNSLFCANSDYFPKAYFPYRKGMDWIEFVDYIVDNNQQVKIYFFNEYINEFEEGYLKRYTNETLKYKDHFEYSDFFIPVGEHFNPDIIDDPFFSFGKGFLISEQTFIYYFPNQFDMIPDLETLYPEEYNKIEAIVNDYDWNHDILDAKYGCYWFNGG